MVDSSSLAFWGILGGLSLLCVVTVLLAYFVCFSRNPKFCMSTENEELLETTVQHEEVHTVTSETCASVSGCEEPTTVVRRTEHVHRVIRKQRSWGNVLQALKSEPVTKIHVSPRSESLDTQTSSNSSGHCEYMETAYGNSLTSPRPGKPQITSIGALS